MITWAVRARRLPEDAPAVGRVVPGGPAGAPAQAQPLLQDGHGARDAAVRHEVGHAVQQRLRLAHHPGLLILVSRILQTLTNSQIPHACGQVKICQRREIGHTVQQRLRLAHHPGLLILVGRILQALTASDSTCLRLAHQPGLLILIGGILQTLTTSDSTCLRLAHHPGLLILVSRILQTLTTSDFTCL